MNNEKALEVHEINKGKLKIESKVSLNNADDLSIAYTPGVADVCKAIELDRENIYKYTIKGNTVAVVTDGSSVLGLGDIGVEASLPVMEGKCALFKRFAGIDAFPVCIDTRDTDTFVETVKRIATPFGGINLEDIAAPRCFEIEKRLIDELNIPVFHDDQHGTAIVVLAALINALAITGRTPEKIAVVINGAGAAGTAISKLLLNYGVKDIIVCDRKGALYSDREDLPENQAKYELARLTNPQNRRGELKEVIKGADVFIGVSGPNLVSSEMVKTMADDPVCFALANPKPEIMPDDAKAGGAAVVGTGRSDMPNQINNVLAFPGIFKGMLESRRRFITDEMKLLTAKALAQTVKNPNPDKIVPNIFEPGLADAIAEAIKSAGYAGGAKS